MKYLIPTLVAALFAISTFAAENVQVTVYNQNFGLVREVRDVDVGTGTVELEFRDVAANIQPETVSIKGSDMVFVGYGVQAPEFNWDDFKGMDLKGKTLVVLVGDPPVPDPSDPTRPDPKVFGGKAMTYYGRWTYKYEIAAELGAQCQGDRCAPRLQG